RRVHDRAACSSWRGGRGGGAEGRRYDVPCQPEERDEARVRNQRWGHEAGECGEGVCCCAAGAAGPDV
ncbi:hypothetical protein LTS18_007741, partial [Coniosporium uncinatum]